MKLYIGITITTTFPISTWVFVFILGIFLDFGILGNFGQTNIVKIHKDYEL